jgi:hypothetical protein
LKNYDEALVDIKAAIKLAPSDVSLRNEYESIKKSKADFDLSQQGSIKAFFSQGLYNEKQANITKNYDTLPDFS